MNEIELRDYFAGLAMQAFMSNWHQSDDWNAFEYADMAYTIADVMMKAREE